MGSYVKWAAVFVGLVVLGLGVYWPYRTSVFITEPASYDPSCEADVRQVKRQLEAARRQADAGLAVLREEYGTEASNVQETAKYMVGVHQGRLIALPCYNPGL